MTHSHILNLSDVTTRNETMCNTVFVHKPWSLQGSCTWMQVKLTVVQEVSDLVVYSAYLQTHLFFGNRHVLCYSRCCIFSGVHPMQLNVVTDLPNPNQTIGTICFSTVTAYLKNDMQSVIATVLHIQWSISAEKVMHIEMCLCSVPTIRVVNSFHANEEYKTSIIEMSLWERRLSDKYVICHVSFALWYN